MTFGQFAHAIHCTACRRLWSRDLWHWARGTEAKNGKMYVTVTFPPEMLPSPDEGEVGVVMVQCPTCKGSGYTYVDHSPDWCEKCGGEGFVAVQQSTVKEK